MSIVSANRKVMIGGSLVLLGGVAWLAFLICPRVQVLDSRFRVLTAKVSRGTNHTVFHGSQLEGKLRDMLRRVGLNVKRLPQDTARTQSDAYAFMMRYTGDFTREELGNVRAELTDGVETVIPLRWHSGGCYQTKKEYLAVWVLDSLPTHRATFHLRLRLATNEVYLADLRVGRL